MSYRILLTHYNFIMRLKLFRCQLCKDGGWNFSSRSNISSNPSCNLSPGCHFPPHLPVKAECRLGIFSLLEILWQLSCTRPWFFTCTYTMQHHYYNSKLRPSKNENKKVLKYYIFLKNFQTPKCSQNLRTSPKLRGPFLYKNIKKNILNWTLRL